MKSYEFSTNITPDGRLVIPATLAKEMPVGESVKVIVLVNEHENGGENFLLENIIAEIKKTPQNPANITPASGLLAEHLLNSPEEADPSFDLEVWEREWDNVEATMKAIEFADQNSEFDIELS
jgi:hypothetical protein